MTNEQLAQLIATLISDFIRPNAQQHLESMERLDRIEQLLERHAEVIAGVDIKLDQLSTITQEVASTQAAAVERMSAFDERLEETRALVAKNSSDMAQNNAAQEQRSQEIDGKLDRLIEENRAFRESQQTQLAAIIGNGRRIDRLEQRAS